MNAVYAIGSNGSGQLGIGHREDVSVPKPVRFDPQPPTSIVQVAAGGNHTLLLSESGKLHWSGESTSGACGLGHASDVPKFREARLVRDGEDCVGPVSSVAATWEASILVARDKEGKRTTLWSMGVGLKGELGLGELLVRTSTATRVNHFPPGGTEIVDLSACMGHVVAVLSNGDVFGWGNCRKGQIGEPGAIVYSPRKIEGIEFKVTRVVCCKEATCLFGEPSSGHMLILGADKWGIKSQAPRVAPHWKGVAASWSNVFILRVDGALESWGRDDHGQLPPPKLPRLQAVVAGSEHVVALSEAGDVLSWGWGEHGNCGPQVENSNVKGRWNVIASSKFIPIESRISAVGAGCATSWICILSGIAPSDSHGA